MVCFAKRTAAALALSVVLSVTSVASFAPTSLRTTPSVVLGVKQQHGSRAFVSTSLNVASVPDKNSGPELSYAERSRIYRRDTFSYDLWVKHRSTDRFIGNLLDILKSGILRQLLPEIALVGGVALFVCLYNALFVTGYDDLEGIHHAAVFVSQYLPVLKLPQEFFTLSTPSLALLLGKDCYMCVLAAWHRVKTRLFRGASLELH